MSDVDDIIELLVRYATAIDTRDWNLLRSCFTADAFTDYGDIGVWHDVEGIVDFMVTAHGGFGATNHMLSNLVVRVTGDEATATSYVHAVLAFAADPTAWIDSVGTYRDVLARSEDGWRIASRVTRLTRTTASS